MDRQPQVLCLLSHCHMVLMSPPSVRSAFVHRCGRTARIGHGGSALVFLLPMEESYVSFLAINQKVSCLLLSSHRMPRGRGSWKSPFPASGLELRVGTSWRDPS